MPTQLQFWKFESIGVPYQEVYIFNQTLHTLSRFHIFKTQTGASIKINVNDVEEGFWVFMAFFLKDWMKLLHQFGLDTLMNSSYASISVKFYSCLLFLEMVTLPKSPLPSSTASSIDMEIDTDYLKTAKKGGGHKGQS